MPCHQFFQWHLHLYRLPKPRGPGGDRLACIDNGHPIGGGQKPGGDHPIPTLDALFDVHEEIETEIEVTDTGIDVIQTSSNPEVVKLLQTRAAEVSDMSERGMAAVHERMSQ